MFGNFKFYMWNFLFLHYALDNALARWNSLFDHISLLDSPKQLSECSEGTKLIDIFDSDTTVPVANVDMHRTNSMEDCMYALLLLSLSKT